jgi:uncharacterized integral membrane protein
MKRWFAIVPGVLVVLAAIVFSVINAESAPLDLYFLDLTLPVGVLVLLSVLSGFLIAGAVLYAGVILPLRMRLSAARRDAARREPTPPA